MVAKCDKQLVREELQKLRTKGKGMVLNQRMLVAVICKSINRVPSSKWEESFMKVNFHPDHRMPFDEWVKKIDSQLEEGQFFTDGDTSLYCAMPEI